MYVQRLNVKSKNIGALETDLPLAGFGITAYAALNLRIDVVASGVAGTVTVKLQHRPAGGDYEDLASANSSVVLADGNNAIQLNVQTAADLVDMPIRSACRLVVTSDGAGAAIIDSVSVQQG